MPGKLDTCICWMVMLASVFPAFADDWKLYASNPSVRYRGLAIVSADDVLASGTLSSVTRLSAGNANMMRAVDRNRQEPEPQASDAPPGKEKANSAAGLPANLKRDFRDIEVLNPNTWVALAIGDGTDSRVLRTTDAGESWTTTFVNPSAPKGFFDAIAFWDDGKGLLMGDPVDGKFCIYKTSDGGVTWQAIDPAGMPAALPNEGGFAASGTCLITGANGYAWFATGGANKARVFRSTDWGNTWQVSDTPVRAGSASCGIFSIAFADSQHGVAVGGDYLKMEADQVVAVTTDGGKTWRVPKGTPPAGFRSGACFYSAGNVRPKDGSPPANASAPTSAGNANAQQHKPILIAVGPTGCDQSHDLGETWSPLAGKGFHVVKSANGTTPAVWAAGEQGRIGKLIIEPK